MNESIYQAETEGDFARARARAFFNEIAATIARRPNEPLSFEAVKRSLKVFGQAYRGVQTVQIDKIIGSATLRYNDFDRAFLPTQARTKMRWRNIDRLYYQNVDLPPVQLYQIGEFYFVRDGHHRISVARQRGQQFIEGEVIEVQTRVALSADLTAHDLEIVGEYADFLERTQIDQLRPDQVIKFSEPGGYTRLIEHIAVHRYFMGVEQHHRIAWQKAVASWYDNLYLPAVKVIREHNVLKEFPGRTEADLYLWIMDHQYFLSKQDENVGLEDAAIDFAEHFSERIDKKLLRNMRRALAEFLGGEDLLPVEGTMASEPHHPDEEGNEPEQRS
jgi:hypothetical protein